MAPKNAPTADTEPAQALYLRFLGFLWHAKKFWLPPLLLAMLLLALLYYLAGKSEVMAPFIYDL